MIEPRVLCIVRELMDVPTGRVLGEVDVVRRITL